MRPEILALFIPIVFLVGLFSVIALNIISKYKSKAMIANRVSSIEEWYKTEAQSKIIKTEAQVQRKKGMGLRICGLMIGLGLGVFVGCVILACGGISVSVVDHQFDMVAIGAFMIISLAIFCGGAGMIGAYFLERKLDGKSKAGTPAAK